MLRWRLIGAAAVLAPLLLLLWLDVSYNFGRPGIWLVPVGLLVVLLATSDLVALLKSRAKSLRAGPIYAGGIVIVLLTCLPLAWEQYPIDCVVGRLGWTLLGLLAAMGIAVAGEMQRFRAPGDAIINVATSVFCCCYLAVPISFFLQLRTTAGNEWGMVALVSVILVVKIADAGAYFAGRALGGRLFGGAKMAPILSPKKTWEGAVGALVAGSVGAWVSLASLPQWLGASSDPPFIWWAVVLYGVALTAAGMFGDLAESLIKRDADQKDSSNLLPGLGGMLDVVDSLLTAAPVAFVFWAAGIVGPAA